jgi:glycosyltransferase involved in cell wall biosynthesis
MRVWIIEVGEPLPLIDGNYRDWRCGMLSKALAARGHEVLWWASNFDHFRKRRRFPGPRRLDLEPNLSVILLDGPGYGRNTSPKRWLHHRILARAFTAGAPGSPAPEVIFCCLPTLELAEAAIRFGRARNIHVVIDVRDLWPDHYLTLAPKKLAGVLRLALRPEFNRARRLLKGAAGLTAISATFLNWALNLAGRESALTDGVFPLGYPVTSAAGPDLTARQADFISRYNLDPGHLIITFVGTLCSSYALDTVIAAARRLSRTGGSRIHFVLVGSGDQEAKIKSMAQGLRNVSFTGWCDQDSVLAILGLSAVGLAPYREDASMSLPNKPFEYMAAGLPLLSSLPGELESLLRINRIGLQYRAHEVSSLLEQIEWLAANPDLRREMGIRAQELLQTKFSAAAIYPSLVRHLEKIAAGSGPGRLPDANSFRQGCDLPHGR